MSFLKKRGKRVEIEKFDEKWGKIYKLLTQSEKPINYKEISNSTNIPKDEVFTIIGKKFTEATKETTESAMASDDFDLLADKVEAIHNNKYLKVIRARLKHGETASKMTRGVIR